jgi:hypothetical protein
VAWVWAPNTEDAPSASWNHWTNYYPGDPYVDWVGIDGFNWGTTHTWATWRTLAQIIGPMYADYAATKPIMVAETGSVEQGGSKSQWFTGARNDIENTFPSVAAFVYFDAGDSHSPSDFRVTTSATAASAYKAMGQDPYFKPRQGGGTQAPPPPVSGVFVWPQPATKSAPVAFTTGSSVTVSIQIQNSSGGVVRQLATAVPYGAGTFAVTWDRKDDRGRKTGAGTYRAVVTATDSTGASSTDSQLFQAK